MMSSILLEGQDVSTLRFGLTVEDVLAVKHALIDWFIDFGLTLDRPSRMLFEEAVEEYLGNITEKSAFLRKMSAALNGYIKSMTGVPDKDRSNRFIQTAWEAVEKNLRSNSRRSPSVERVKESKPDIQHVYIRVKPSIKAKKHRPVLSLQMKLMAVGITMAVVGLGALFIFLNSRSNQKVVAHSPIIVLSEEEEGNTVGYHDRISPVLYSNPHNTKEWTSSLEGAMENYFKFFLGVNFELTIGEEITSWIEAKATETIQSLEERYTDHRVKTIRTELYEALAKKHQYYRRQYGITETSMKDQGASSPVL